MSDSSTQRSKEKLRVAGNKLIRRCEVDITGRETPKNLVSALPRLRNDDSMTLKWTDTGDTILVTRIKNEYTLNYCSHQKNYSLYCELNLKTITKVLNAFRQNDYEPEKFWVSLVGLTPVSAMRENNAENPSYQQKAKPVDVQDIVLERYQATMHQHRETQQRFTPPTANENTFRQWLENPLTKVYLFFIIVGTIFYLYDVFDAPRKALEAAKERAINEQKAAVEKAEMDAKNKKYDLEHPYVKAAPNYASESNFKSVLGRVFVGTALYNKGTHSPFGFIVGVESESVWVADSFSANAGNLQLYSREYSRRYITDNFETK